MKNDAGVWIQSILLMLAGKCYFYKEAKIFHNTTLEKQVEIHRYDSYLLEAE